MEGQMTTGKQVCVTVFTALVLIVGGCSDDSGNGPTPDTGGTPGPDAAAGQDTGTPDPDASSPQLDGTTPVADLAATDQGSDAKTRDPRITSDPNPDAVACAKATCHPSKGEVCCVSMFGMSCKLASACGGLAAPAHCDGPEDCPSGQHCCVGFPSGAKCDTNACSGQSQELCNYDQDCATKHCTACKGPGSSLVYGLCTTGTKCPSPYVKP
jgi:hypothetical protein